MNNKIRKSGNYTALANEIVNDSRLNLRSLGLFLHMWSKPDNWNFTISNIAKARNVGQDQIKSALQELKKIGYVRYEKLKDGTGIYYLSDTTDTIDRTNIQDPKAENPHLASYSQAPLAKSGKPKCGFSTPLINTIWNNRDIYFHEVQMSDEEEADKWEKINQLLLEIQMRKDKKIKKLEALAEQSKPENCGEI